jgi:hypothetical protein
MGEVTKAGAPIGMTLQLKPELAEAHLLAGNILLRVNQRERALMEYREYLRLAPKGVCFRRFRTSFGRSKIRLRTGTSFPSSWIRIQLFEVKFLTVFPELR